MKLADPVYVAGPPGENLPMFEEVASVLRMCGHVTYNPVDLKTFSPTMTDDEYLRGALRLLLWCNSVVMLPDWEQSKGASIEYRLAKDLGMEVWQWRDLQSLHLVGTSLLEETTDSVSGADTEVGTGITAELEASVTSIGTARATGSRSARRATRGHTPTQ
jgi:hypothetical protein